MSGAEVSVAGMVNSKAYLDHPQADEVSLAIGAGSYCTFPYSVELAFFKGSQSFVEFDELAEYEMQGVYGYVPLEKLASILDRFGVK